MKLVQQGATLRVSDIPELDAAHAPGFREAVGSALAPGVTQVDIDLSRTRVIDCRGVGALVGLRNCARRNNSEANLRLSNAPESARRMIQLTGLGEAFTVSE